MKKKMYVLILTALLAISLLCACGTSNTEETTVPSNMLSTEPAETTAATTAPEEETAPTETTIPEETTEPSTEPTTAETEPAETTAQHTHSYTSTVVAPTCTTDGYTLHKCKTCGYSYTSNTSAAYEHTFIYEVHDATATEWGYVLHICRDCDYAFKDNYTEPLATGHTHNYTAAVTAPTCYEQGYTTYTCVCGSEYTDDYVPASGHDYTVIHYEPTCTSCSYTQYTCKDCGHEYFHNNATEDTPAYNDSLGHDYVVTTVAPTIDSEGYDLYTCQRCGESYKNNYTDKLPGGTEPPATEHVHDYVPVIVAPTCLEQGYTQHLCDCGDSYTTDEKEPTGHTLAYFLTDEPGCYPNDIGYTCYKCENCGYCEHRDNKESTGAHTWGAWETTRAATTDVEGEEMRTCSVCQFTETRTTEKLPAETEHQHNYTENVTAPTCTAGGYTTFTCTCGDSYIGNETNAIGHSWGEWTLTQEPTTSEYGEETRSCACGETESREVEKLIESHTHSYTEDVTNPTCTTGGYTTFTCTCGDSYIGNETNAAGHSWGEWETTVEATTESEGTKVRICSACGETESQQIEKKAPAATSDNIYDLVNAARAENGLSPLTYYADGQQAADIRVAELNELFDHMRPDGSTCFTVETELGLSKFMCGENIAGGYRTTTSVMNAWMNSPGHRANILSTYYTHIAVATDGYYWVMLFFVG